MIKMLFDLILDRLHARRSRRLMRSLGVRRVSVPTLGTAIRTAPTEEPDYSPYFGRW